MAHGLSASATRYQSKLGIAHRDQVIDGVTIRPSGRATATPRCYGSRCVAQRGICPGFVPAAPFRTRRRISAAVINCIANNVHGNSTNVPVEKWIELFLVEPSLNQHFRKTNAGDSMSR